MTAHRFTPRLGPIAALLAILWCSVHPSTESRADPWAAIPAEAWEQSARPDSGGGDAIVLLDEGTVEHQNRGFRFDFHRRVRIFTEPGRDAGKVEVDYLKNGTKLLGIQARSLRRDGTVTELAPDQIITSTVAKSGGVEYSRLSFIVPGIEPGCIIEYRYTLSGSYEGFWVWPWYFQNPRYTVESRYRWRPSDWSASEGLKPHWILKGISESRSGQSCMPDCMNPQTVSFVARAIPGTKDEEWSPPIQDTGPRVITSYVPGNLSSIEFWSLWKRALDGISRDFSRDVGGLERVVEVARQKHAEPEAALVAVHNWLRTNVRSTAEWSWQELQAERRRDAFWGKEPTVAALIRKGEGSPYEINMAFAAAANMLGLGARVLLVRDRREGAFDHRLIGSPPTEAITVVQAKGSARKRFYNPASRFAIAGNLPWYLRGSSALVAGGGSDLVLSVHPDEGVPALADWSLDLTLDTAGEIAGRIQGSMLGEEARSYRAWLWTEDPRRWPELLAHRMAPGAVPKLGLALPDLTEAPDSALKVSGSANYPGVTSVTGTLMSVPVEKLAPWRLRGGFSHGRRIQSVFFHFQRTQRVIVDLHLPPGASVEGLPAPGSFDNGVGSWRTRWTRTTDGLRLERLIELRFAELPPADYQAVRDLFAGLDAADREVILVRMP